ncbi:peroxin-6 [Cryptococcus neoformans C23]|uniref:Peroxisomal ATPase PEX6 n=1 Tax=Cryptococcus neoformans (strain H99 / ATCC 208821 / CBS 10515 / FGSC 9487) TaxID=235443 RepID=J9VYX7_CRYN9|nr:peroxin-6 [Cryptococcus neoformans var. grubii H99]AUB26871.1 peroxin-6 [Cryptococcus neoformans var. grubii]OWZ29211.1 peroxin-6 [Cryptococcus neoformans var. grubii AD2-60a]OWZ41077.1 peroxin-6 [Cryptococcus neoformans var. grubii C23]OXC82982.1 peroxin-6 [Cryptococcus neoformans var. grubii AD1-7a]AFR96905.2 peroxin-6 [Cryptococcus neoformans var. grubii H99]|eukprot:XP_012051430.1 peroxin-6 [Cryptococcus neoformans var. grubii H99]
MLMEIPSLRAQVEPLLVVQSPSSPFAHQTAHVNSSLWNRLRATRRREIEGGDTNRICVAIKWPEDGRLCRGKGKGKSTVVWVEEGEDKGLESIILVHPSLIPAFYPTPLPISLHIHQPVNLSLAVLQPAFDSPEDRSSSNTSEDVNFSDIWRDSNYPIIRQGAIISCRSGITTNRYKVLMLEPVHQGILTAETNIIISNTFFFADTRPSMQTPLGDGMSEGSFGKTHLSLANFDADVFLSSCLSLSLKDDLPDGEALGDEELMTLSSTTSGSLTPRPPGAGVRPISPAAPVEEVLQHEESEDRGVRFTPVVAEGKAIDGEGDDVCWMGVGGLGRAGIFEGDWVLVKPIGQAQASGRLAKALAWELLDEPDDELPANTILLSPSLYRSLIPSSSSSSLPQLTVVPTPFGARTPTLPIANKITLARIATAEAVDKRYERSWLRGQATLFAPKSQKGKENAQGYVRMVRRGDMLGIPVWLDKTLTDEERQKSIAAESGGDTDSDSESDSPSPRFSKIPPAPTNIIYFAVTSISYNPLVPIEEDFRSSTTAKARAGELGCWVGDGTELVYEGLEKARIEKKGWDKRWSGIRSNPPPFSRLAYTKLSDILNSTFFQTSIALRPQLSVIVKGARGAGKRSLIEGIADDIGFNIITVDCYDILGDTPAVTSGTLLARLSKSISCSPSLLVLHHVEALSSKSDSPLGRPPPIVKVLEEVIDGASQTSNSNSESSSSWPVIVIGTTADADAVPSEVLACFKQEIELKAPNEDERLAIMKYKLEGYEVAPDVDVRALARQTAALNAGDIDSFVHLAWNAAVKRSTSSCVSFPQAQQAGISITDEDFTHALSKTRAAYSDSIGAPKIPNVSWDDVGGLVSVKQDILDTIQLPLERPEMFGEGLKKRSGILLYGPPGTGKTLLAKAVATSFSLNFFSVKGPELLNMYIGESEANVRRIFQRARDAAPCVIFMDELDSIAPKRGNQGDSGGVMDRIVSQLLAELDGMSSSRGGVFVMGATNRPDLLDPALLRPGRFDKMLYLSIPTTHTAQASILTALTRKFNLHPNLDIEKIAEQCPFNYTGADLYALCADAMLGAMTRQAEAVDRTIAKLNASVSMEEDPSLKTWPGELTPQYYLAKIATKEETEVVVRQQDFEEALIKLVPSVSEEELKHYERVQKEFQGYAIGKKDDVKEVKDKGKGKGKAVVVNGEAEG